MKKLLSVWSLTMLMVMLVGVSSCKKDDNSGGNSNTLVGKWKFQDEDITAYWTFNSDGTMLVNDEYDAFNGQTVKYTYNDDSKQLTLAGGLIVYQLTWNSSTQFQIKSINCTFTKV